MTPAHKINAIVLTACTGGMAWLVLNIWVFKSDTFFNTLGCPIKSLTGFACPSCGITRALQLLFTGHLGAAFMANPLSFIVGGIIVLAPIWITLDLLQRKDSFYKAYICFEKTINIKSVAFILIGLIAINWVWNIYKGL